MKLEFESNTASMPLVANEDLKVENLSSNKSPEVMQMLRDGIKAAQEGNRAEARQMLLRVTEADSNNENAWLWLASISEYPEELLVFLNNVLNINPENERAIEWAKATKSLLAKTFVQRGINAVKEEQKSFAKQCFLQAIVHDSKSELAWLWLASVSNSPEEKISHLQKVLSINPENENAHSSMASAKMQIAQAQMPKAKQAAVEGNHDEAQKMLDNILAESPNFEDAWLLKTHLSDSLSEKMMYFEKVLSINPNNEAAKAGLVSLKSLVGEVSAPAKSEEDNQDVVEEVKDEEIKVDQEYEEPEFKSEDKPEAVEIESEEPVEEVLSEQQDDFVLDVEPQVELNDVEEQEHHFEEEVVDYFSEEQPSEDLEVEQDHKVQDLSANESEVDPNEEAVSFDYEPDDSVEEVENLELQDDNLELQLEEENEHSAQDDVEMSDADNEVEFSDADNEVEMPVSEMEMSNEAQKFQEAEDDFVADESQMSEASEEEPYVDENSIYAQETVEMQYDEVKGLIDEEHQVEQNDNFIEEPQMPQFDEMNQEEVFAPTSEDEQVAKLMSCPFCNEANEPQSFACKGCSAILTLSDTEMILGHEKANKEIIKQSVEMMEEERKVRNFDAGELKQLGIGYINIKEMQKGIECLKEAVQADPENVLLVSHIDSLAIRLAEIEEKEKAADDSPATANILVVDDSPTVRKLISGKLEKCGHDVVCAVDGMDALAKINEVIPDLILLDITMPRMDGYQVCKLIRSNDATKDVPVVMISGKDGFFDKVRGKMAGTTNYITKPFGPETLMKTINEYID